MSPTHSRDQNLYTRKLDNHKENVTTFLAKPPDQQMTVRDYALLGELWQLYDDMLGAMEDMPLDFHPQVEVEIDGNKIEFSNIDEVAEWLSPFME